MVKKMLIDATHPEEMRVVVVDGTRLEEFDVETSTKKQLKGNIYLAKVIRVEPSLQAAFVDYGNDRHGFLPFSEIHPDYYQIPVADREALKESLIQSQQASARREEEEVERMLQGNPEDEEEPAEVEDITDEEDSKPKGKQQRRRHNHHRSEMKEAAEVEMINDSDDVRSCRNYFDMLRRYKIQEVIHRNQILLVQVVKEERGNKGAALTTYLSLAGRYCVLMPNNARGGGVSRKISNMADRHKLKTIVNALPIPDGMSVIIRTAGRERTKIEIKRDYEYLIKTWVQIRDMTMASVAPTLIHEEGNLIRRSIRDIYTPEIAEILIEGEDEFKSAKEFVKMIIPSHAKKVINYTDDVPLFHRYQVEAQLESLHNPIVQLKSGGYLVINPTEALVAIDVNSGRSTKEHSIEDTALKTNLEAVDEVARQLKLRDLAGLIVIDLIDMEENRNNSAVERRMRDVLRKDRARIQMAKINGFGLMEISRQRLHSSFIETSYHTCPYCQGTGVQRSVESISVHLLRLLEEEGSRQRNSDIILTVPSNIALYVLNHKRSLIAEIENTYGIKVVVNGDDGFIAPTDYRIEKSKRAEAVKYAKPQNNKHTDTAESEVKEEDLSVTLEDTSADDNEEEPKRQSADDAERDNDKRKNSGRRGLFGRRRQRHLRNRDDEPKDKPSMFSGDKVLEEAPARPMPKEDKFDKRRDDGDAVSVQPERKAEVKKPVAAKKPKGAVILFSSHHLAEKKENPVVKVEDKPTAVVAIAAPEEQAAPEPKKRGRKPKAKPQEAEQPQVQAAAKKGKVAEAVADTSDTAAKPAADKEETAKKPKKGGWWSKLR